MPQGKPLWDTKRRYGAGGVHRGISPESFRSWLAVVVSACALGLSGLKYYPDWWREHLYDNRGLIVSLALRDTTVAAWIRNDSPDIIDLRSVQLYVDSMPVSDTNALLQSLHITRDELVGDPTILSFTGLGHLLRPASSDDIFRLELKAP